MTSLGTSAADACPCGGASYRTCCAPFLLRESWPSTAEQLMRSRYTAFAVQDAEHLLRTWHPRTRPEAIALGERRWTGLTITDRVDGAADDLMGIVAFTAHWLDDDRPGTLTERSAFVKRGGRWFYLAPTPDG